MMMRRALIYVLFQLVLIIRIVAANNSVISHIGIEQGLSNNSVRCIYQDHNGFMWFGTYDGLNRYDGYEFKVFRNSFSDTTSLPHNYIYTINEDHDNNLWIGTGQGIGILNKLTSKFLPAYYIPYQTKRKEKISVNVLALTRDDKGNMFIGTNGWGLLIQNEKDDAAIQFPCIKGGVKSTTYNVESVVIDKNKQVWLFVMELGLCRYDYSTRSIQVVSNSVKFANTLAVDDAENIWIGAANGLYRYSISTNSIVKVYKEQVGQLSSDNIACLSFDKQHNLWIGTEGGGVDILNPGNERIEYLLPGENKYTLNSESVFAIYHDKDERKWMGTLKGGINKIDPIKNQFQTISHDPLNSNSLIYNFASCFLDDKGKRLWIGTDGGGLSIWNRVENTFTNYRHDANNPSSLSNNSVTSIIPDYSDNIWISTFGGGINKFHRSSNSFEHYKCINEVTGEENSKVVILYQDVDRNLWATTFINGKLYRLNRQANKFEVFNQDFADLISMAEDRSHGLWAGNSHQLIKIDKENKRHLIYEIGKPVRAIYEDNQSRLWIGTEGGGLVLFDREQGKIIARYSDEEGLCNNSVLNILQDNRGSLWLSTFNGLSQFNPHDKSFKNYYQDDGLQSNQFLYHSALRLQTGELACGGIKGFNIFYPDSVQLHYTSAPILLTGLRINNTPVTTDGKYISKLNGDKIEKLEVPFNEAVISFDFAALEYSAPRKISYAYFLEGWDKGWTYSGKIRTANYTHLREGNYTLRIKCTNADGSSNLNEYTLKITILPPWYRSWWAYTFYILLVAGAIYAYIQYKARQSRMEYEIQLAKVNAEKERAELKQERTERERAEAEYLREKAEHETERVINEREKEINEKRLSFFTNISHEFRTPLTLIINPIKDLLQKDERKYSNGNDELKIVYRNARRMLSLVDQLLLFRKAEVGADKLKITKIDLAKLCREVFLAFVQQAKALHIDYRFECLSEDLQIYADREKMEIVLYNLISNALKYTRKGECVVLTLKETSDSVHVEVADSGHGIPKEIGDKLFEKFYQVQEKDIPKKSGFGIGLYLVKHFIERLKGKIWYVSEPHKGTTFFIELKKGKEHFSKEVLFEEASDEAVFLEELVADADIDVATDAKEVKKELEPLISENQSILIIDDDHQIREYIAQVFEERFTVYQSDSAEEGLYYAQKYMPDIIISDVNMQGMSGIDLCKVIKNTSALSHIPVILLTGSSSSQTKLEGVEGGADDYITKPFEKELLVARVASILKSRTTLQKYFYNEVTLQKNPLKISEEYKNFLERCISVVEHHLDDDQFTIKIFASEIGMSHSNLYKRVKAISGQSVNAFIRFIRLRKAAEILINTNSNINETALQVGFNDAKYFREQFSKLFGMKPSEYVKKYRKVFGKSFNLNEEGYLPDSN
jgi:signal transduction histidine kinase/ligand-binding sensor domain-containing protein/DNA-binding response OmpR family regulator